MQVEIIEDPHILDAYYTYYAAYIDGEGHIGIKKTYPNKSKGYSPSYTERVSVASTNEMIIRSFNDLVVGYISYHKPSKLSKRGYWSWEVTNHKARVFLGIIQPFLKLKSLQSKIVLVLGKNKEKIGKNKIPIKDLKLREDLYKILRVLHGN